MKHYRKILLILFLIALPWQTRWIVEDVLINEGVSQYGRLSVYVFDVLLVLFLASAQHVWNAASWKRVRSEKILRFALIGLWGMIGMAVLSMLWTVEPMAGLFASGHLLLAGLLFTTLVLDKDISPDLILGSLAIGMIVPSALAWWQSAQQSVSASTLLGIAAQDPEVLGTAVIEHEGGRWLRAYGTFPHPNILGGFAAFGLLSAMIVSIRNKWSRSAIPLALSAALMGGALVMSGSRAAWIALALGLIFLYEWIMAAKNQKRQSNMQLILISMMIPILGIGFALRGPLASRFDGSQRLESISTTERLDQWSDVSAFLQGDLGSVIAGVGSGNYVFALSKMRPLWESWVYQPVHNVPALVLVELGILGVAFMLLFVIATDWNAHRKWRRANGCFAISLGLCVLTLAVLDHYLWTQPSGLYLLTLFFVVNMKLGEEVSTPA